MQQSVFCWFGRVTLFDPYSFTIWIKNFVNTYCRGRMYYVLLCLYERGLYRCLICRLLIGVDLCYSCWNEHMYLLDDSHFFHRHIFGHCCGKYVSWAFMRKYLCYFGCVYIKCSAKIKTNAKKLRSVSLE